MATRRKADTAKRQPQERKASKALRQTVLARRSGSWTMSVPEAGRKYYGLGRNASYEAAAAGQIPTIKVNKLLRVPVHMIERMLGGPIAAE